MDVSGVFGRETEHKALNIDAGIRILFGSFGRSPYFPSLFYLTCARTIRTVSKGHWYIIFDLNKLISDISVRYCLALRFKIN